MTQENSDYWWTKMQKLLMKYLQTEKKIAEIQINWLKDRNRMAISVFTLKSFDKIQCPLMINSPRDTWNRRNISLYNINCALKTNIQYYTKWEKNQTILTSLEQKGCHCPHPHPIFYIKSKQEVKEVKRKQEVRALVCRGHDSVMWCLQTPSGNS